MRTSDDDLQSVQPLVTARLLAEAARGTDRRGDYSPAFKAKVALAAVKTSNMAVTMIG